MIAVWLTLALAVIVMLIAALGLLRLPDSLARQHAVTKAVTLALSIMILSLIGFVILQDLGGAWILRLVVLLIILLAFIPLASHALAKSGYQEMIKDEKGKTDATEINDVKR